MLLRAILYLGAIALAVHAVVKVVRRGELKAGEALEALGIIVAVLLAQSVNTTMSPPTPTAVPPTEFATDSPTATPTPSRTATPPSQDDTVHRSSETAKDILLLLDGSRGMNVKAQAGGDFMDDEVRPFVEEVFTVLAMNEEQHRIAIAMFDDSSDLLHSLTTDYDLAKDRVMPLIRGGGGDQLALGLATGHQELLKNRVDADKVLVVVSDGLQSANASPAEDVRNKADQIKADGITIYWIAAPSWAISDERRKWMKNLVSSQEFYYEAANKRELLQAFGDIIQ